jgi:hypothetical protein
MLDRRALNPDFWAPTSIETAFIAFGETLNLVFNYSEKFLAVTLKLAGPHAEDA